MNRKIKKNDRVYNFILIFWLLQIMCFTWLNIYKIYKFNTDYCDARYFSIKPQTCK